MTSPPMKLVDQLTEEFMEGHATRQDDLESPGSGGASPYLSASPSLMTSPPMKLVDQLTEEFMGVTPQGRMNWKAPVRAEPHKR
jgi:hypothetical protein